MMEMMGAFRDNEVDEACMRFVDYGTEECGGDKKVLEFISKMLFVRCDGMPLVDSREVVISLYRKFSKEFALILECTFPGGKICYCQDSDKIVYVLEEVAYDIEGVVRSKYNLFNSLDGSASVWALVDNYDCREIVKRSKEVALRREYSALCKKIELEMSKLRKKLLDFEITHADYNVAKRELCRDNGINFDLIRRLKREEKI